MSAYCSNDNGINLARWRHGCGSIQNITGRLKHSHKHLQIIYNIYVPSNIIYRKMIQIQSIRKRRRRGLNTKAAT